MIITLDQLRRLAPKARADIIGPLADAMPSVLPAYGITTAARFDQFIAQCAHESDGFKTLEEYGDGARFERLYGYQTRVGHNLGNKQAGDGARYHGRGIIMITGRDNYRYYGGVLGIDLIAHPELASRPDVSLRIACEYWKRRGLNALADVGDLRGITRHINGGYNGLSSRAAYLKLAQSIWPTTAALGTVPVPTPQPIPAPAPPVAAPDPAPVPDAPAQAPETPPPAPTELPPVAEQIPDVPEPDAVDLPPIATDGGDPLSTVKNAAGWVGSHTGAVGTGFSLNAIFQNEHAWWIIGGIAGSFLVLVLALLLLFRGAITRWVERKL